MRRPWHSTLPVMLSCALWAIAPAPAADVKPSEDVRWIEDAGGTVMRDSAGRITGVNLRASWVTDTDLRQLLELPHLSYLDLSLTRITDQGMQELKNAPGIVELNVSFAEYVTDEGLGAIKSWKKLKRLNVRGTKVSDTTLEHVSSIKTLESIDFGSALVTDVGIERLAALPNLKEVSMGGTEIGDVGLHALRQLPGITHLDLSGRQGTDSNVWAVGMTEAGFSAILTLKELQELRLGCYPLGVGQEQTRFATVTTTNFSPGWLERMKALSNLKTLKIQGCARIGDEAIPLLSALPGLIEVDLTGTAVTDKGAALLQAAKPKARIYYGPWDAQTASFRNN